MCREPLDVEARPTVCRAGHAYDVARQGYLNLLGSAPPQHADTSDMVAARERFLGSGAFDPLAELLASVVAAANPRVVAEIGAGTGFYLSRVLDAIPQAVGVATDVSVAAARRAAQAHPRLASVVADTWAQLPLRDGSVDVVCSVFAPRNPREFRRVLSPDGVLIVALPGTGHLAGLRERLGLLDIDPVKEQRWRERAAGLLTHHESYPLRTTLELSGAQVHDLVAMGPNAFHARHGVEAARDVLDVTVHVHRPITS